MNETNEPFDREIAARLSAYAMTAVEERPAGPAGVPRTGRRTGRLLALFLIAIVSVGAAVGATAAIASLREQGAGSGAASAASCSERPWPRTVISCDDVYRMGDQAGAQVSTARIWLTTLAAVRSQMNPARQVAEPAADAVVWVIVFDGWWVCCPNAVDEHGHLIPAETQSRWLVVAEASREGTGFIYLQNWSGRPVPARFPAAS